MAAALSPYRLGKARDSYNVFNIFNSISWQFLAANILTLFALRLEASATYIGTLGALLYMAYFFLPLGKILSGRFSLVKIFSVAWICRSISMIPALFAPFFFASGHRDTALLLLFLGVSIFHFFRGIGLIGDSPIMSYLSKGPDQGSYVTQIQVINRAVGMFAGFVIAMLLGRDPPLFLYALIFAVGIGCGIFSGIIVRKVPSPDIEKSEEKSNLFRIFREAITQSSLRNFIFILLMVALVSGVSRTFIIVYCREVFSQSDGMVSLYAVLGGLGALMAGLFIRFLVDRIGAKPLFLICVITGLVSMIPILFFPESMIDNFTTLTLFLTFLFFMMNFGWLGAEGVMQTYFIGLVPSEQMMDMGVLYLLGFGVAGAGGSLLGGVFLDITAVVFGSYIITFMMLYSILIVISLVSLFLMRKLIPLGALPFKGALEVMFSYRDLKAIKLLDKLDKIGDSGQETALLEALQDAPSRLSIKGLLTRARSPRLSVRMECIRAIDALDTLSEDAEMALMDDIINNPYTTAYISARTLGNHGVFQATPLLRELAVSGDYMLAGEAIIALAKLGDHAFRPQVEQIVIESENPRLKIMAVEAFGIYGSPDSLSVLLGLLRENNLPPYLRDATVMAMASILDIQNKFYPLLVRFTEDESVGPTLALDESESAYEFYVSVHGRKWGKKGKNLTALGHQAKALQPAVIEYIRNFKGRDLSRWILELPDELVHGIVQMVISEAILDEGYDSNERLRLLIVHWAAHELRLWTNRLKNEA